MGNRQPPYSCSSSARCATRGTSTHYLPPERWAPAPGHLLAVALGAELVSGADELIGQFVIGARGRLHVDRDRQRPSWNGSARLVL
ncbi:MAG: hypothetical protein ACRDNF_26530 [Streptosporangiaceae bacterium]